RRGVIRGSRTKGPKFLSQFNMIWRRGRDSNPRYGCPYAAFRVRCIQPLCHLSGTSATRGVRLRGLSIEWRPPEQGRIASSVTPRSSAPLTLQRSSQTGLFHHLAPALLLDSDEL